MLARPTLTARGRSGSEHVSPRPLLPVRIGPQGALPKPLRYRNRCNLSRFRQAKLTIVADIVQVASRPCPRKIPLQSPSLSHSSVTSSQCRCAKALYVA